MTRRRKDSSRHGRQATTGSYRIIGGEWRGRRLSFPDEGGVRPTGDRVRETLFNWLQPIIHGSRCLDLFAGSGALGIEALSRGAAEVVFVDRHPALIRGIESNLEILSVNRGRCVCANAEQFLAGPARCFDIVFLDPPFGRVAWPDLCRALASGGWLAREARVYMEDEAVAGTPTVPENWVVLRSARAGNVGYHLASAPGRSLDQPPRKEP